MNPSDPAPMRHLLTETIAQAVRDLTNPHLVIRRHAGEYLRDKQFDADAWMLNLDPQAIRDKLRAKGLLKCP